MSNGSNSNTDGEDRGHMNKGLETGKCPVGWRKADNASAVPWVVVLVEQKFWKVISGDVYQEMESLKTIPRYWILFWGKK